MASFGMQATCFDCIMSGNESEWLPLTESNLYVWRCRRGHHQSVSFRNPRFDLLFEVAIHALVDGYPRECISSSAAALERFYEFALRVMLHADGAATSERRIFEEVWPQLRSSSERQLGAFISVWASEFGSAPRTLDEKVVKTRNDVIHKGKLASRSEAESFAQDVLDVIFANYVLLEQRKAQQIEATKDAALDQEMKGLQSSSITRRGTHDYATVFRRLLHSPDETVTRSIERIEKMAETRRLAN